MQVNIVGPMVCAKHAVRAMSTARGGKGGSIVTIASGAARAPAGLPGIVPYAAAKGRSGDIRARPVQRVASEGIGVNSVSPWVIATDMAFPEAQEAAKHSPLGRMGQPEEIAATVSWVISPEASFVTHSDISVSGGL